MNKSGRPRVEIDKKQFENLCALFCTKEEIARFFECSEDTIDRWCKRTYHETFAVVSAQKRVRGIISLRRAGFEMAQTNPSVHIFYAKNHLGMADHTIIEDKGQDERVDKLIEAIKAV